MAEHLYLIYQFNGIELNLGDDDRICFFIVFGAVEADEGGKVEVLDMFEFVAKLPPFGFLFFALQVGHFVSEIEPKFFTSNLLIYACYFTISETRRLSKYNILITLQFWYLKLIQKIS